MELTRAELHAASAARTREAALSRARKRGEGIVHTPPELARFAAQAAHDLVRDRLGLPGGLADPALALIDPACGPGAFLAAALGVAHGAGAGPSVACGFDRDPHAIASAEAALAGEFQRAGWRACFEVRDTLSEARPEQIAKLAPTLCVLGNPPWIGGVRQAAAAPWLAALLEDFRRDADGSRLEERKLGVLADAYVRFVRWAAEVARCARQGAVVALCVNGSFLDGPVHRGMRAALCRFFDELYLLDLGGNALTAREPGQARDANVFGVRTSVAVLAGVRLPGRDESAATSVRYARVAGALPEKLARLAHERLDARDYPRLELAAPHRRFVPTARADAGYAGWPSLADAMPFHREGVQTNRDRVVIDRDRERLIARLRAFAAGEHDPELAPALGPAPHYDPERARAAVRERLALDPDGARGRLVQRLAYRPFDLRWFAPIAPLCHRPRPELLAAIERSRIVLVSVRKDRGDAPWAHFAAAQTAIDNCLLSTRSSCRARAFPTHDPSGRENLAPEVAGAFAERLGRAIDANEFCEYALAVLASASYRARHDQALRIDYPRIPWPRDHAQFAALCATGRELAALFCRAADPGAARQALAKLVAEADASLG